MAESEEGSENVPPTEMQEESSAPANQDQGPEEDGIDLTENKDGGVIKKVIRQGIGEGHPGKGDVVYVHYVGTLEECGDKFDSSRDRGEEFSFTLGKGKVIKAWDIGVASMRKGEVAQLICKPEYAYGKAGSPPKIGPDATLIFEVELFRWEGEDISPDRDKTITRSLQVDGSKYETPNEGAQIEAHIIGYEDGRVFLDQDFDLQLGECTEAGLPEGIDKALKRFKKGERSLIHLAAKWGYGENGNPHFNIPPNAELDFDIHVKSFEKAKDSWQMNQDEKLEEAEKQKARGTAFFQSGKLKLAAAKYNKMVDLLQFETSLEGEQKEKRDSLYHAAHLNIALCCLKKAETPEVIKHCEKVLEEDITNVKALYRRGLAYQEQGDYEEAVRDFNTVLGVEPGNKAARNQINECKKKIAEQTQKEKKIFANMFDKFAQADEKRRSVESEKKRQAAFPNTPAPAKEEEDDEEKIENASEEGKVEKEEKTEEVEVNGQQEERMES